MADIRDEPAEEMSFLMNHSSESFGSIQLHLDKCLTLKKFETKDFTTAGTALKYLPLPTNFGIVMENNEKRVRSLQTN